MKEVVLHLGGWGDAGRFTIGPMRGAGVSVRDSADSVSLRGVGLVRRSGFCPEKGFAVAAVRF